MWNLASRPLLFSPEASIPLSVCVSVPCATDYLLCLFSSSVIQLSAVIVSLSLSLHLCRRETGNWSRALESQGSLCFAPDNSSAHVSSELLHVQLPGRRGSCSAHGSRSNHVPWICGDHIDMMPQGVGEAGVHRWRDRQNPEVQDTVEIKSFIPRWCQW